MREALRVLAVERGLHPSDQALDSALDRYQDITEVLDVLRKAWLERPPAERSKT
jgi:hypothetical protein